MGIHRANSGSDVRKKALDEADPELVSPFIVWLSEKLLAFLSNKTRLVLQPGQGVSLVVPKKGSTWAAYWSGWQYFYTAPPGTRPLEQISGEPRQRGIGVFARFGFADKDTNPTEWAVSGGIGGRGLIPSRDNDCFGVGFTTTASRRSGSPACLE